MSKQLTGIEEEFNPVVQNIDLWSKETGVNY